MPGTGEKYPFWALAISLFILAVWFTGLLPPVLEHFSVNGVSDTIRSGYRLLCHGIPDRCPELFGRPAAVCMRCSGMYLSIILGCSIVFPLLRKRIQWKPLIYAAVLLTLVMGLQWLLELTKVMKPSSILQISTGFLWGMGLSVLLCSSIDRIRNHRLQGKTR
jgi:uncharacterized membrane protein